MPKKQEKERNFDILVKNGYCLCNLVNKMKNKIKNKNLKIYKLYSFLIFFYSNMYWLKTDVDILYYCIMQNLMEKRANLHFQSVVYWY